LIHNISALPSQETIASLLPRATDFDVSLTVHLSITLDNDQLNAQIFNTFITIL